MSTRISRFPIGGVGVPERKDRSSDQPIVPVPTPRELLVPLKQHIGRQARPCVKEGDVVRKGDVLGEPDGEPGARIHAGISGTVTGIATVTLWDKQELPCVGIRGGEVNNEELLLPPLDLEGLSPEAFREAVSARVREAGIVGLGGAAFPTHIKLAVEEPIDTIIINGAECEPYLTVDDRLMREQAQAVCRGAEYIRMTLGARDGIIACEINKPEAIEELDRAVAGYPALKLARLSNRYPHGAEKQLIKAVLRREVPMRALPAAVGVIVNNVHTAVAVTEAVEKGRVLHSRVITVNGGGVSEPKNLLVPIGTPLAEVISFCGGTVADGVKVIIGGPMTGARTEDLSLPITKGVSAVLLLTEQEYASAGYEVCIRCSKCVEVCPIYLPPNQITAYVNGGMICEAVKVGLKACILCGACQFICPSKRPLVRWLKEGLAASERHNG